MNTIYTLKQNNTYSDATMKEAYSTYSSKMKQKLEHTDSSELPLIAIQAMVDKFPIRGEKHIKVMKNKATMRMKTKYGTFLLSLKIEDVSGTCLYLSNIVWTLSLNKEVSDEKFIVIDQDPSAFLIETVSDMIYQDDQDDSEEWWSK